MLQRPLENVVDLFFPSLCAGCSEALLGGEDVLCMRCLLDLPYTRSHDIPDNAIERRLRGRFPFEAATSLFFFAKNGRVQKMLHNLKYHRHDNIGLWMGALLGDELSKSQRFSQVEYVVPVPLHPRKMKRRGYNQADILAQGMEERGYLRREDALRRIKDNASQTRKHAQARWMNVEGAFAPGHIAGLHGKHVLLLDDVLTTGATLEACAKALMNIPDIKLYVATAAAAEHA